MAYTYSKIATYTVGSGGIASIDFLNIPQTYTDLVIKLSARSNGGFANMQIQFNGDTTAGNYNWRYIRGTGAAANSSAGGSTEPSIYLGEASANGDTANTFGNHEIYIPNYTSSNRKSVSTDAVSENNGTTAYTHLIADIWNSTSPITSIKIYSGTGNLVQHTTAHLYGVKAEL
jgi:hypothetical protein